MKSKTGLVVRHDDSMMVVPPSQAAQVLQAITKASANPKVDIVKLEKLFELHQKVVATEAEAQWNAAMARAQAKIEPVVNNAKNEHTKSSYAKLAAINKAIVPIYTAEGLSISFGTGTPETPGFLRTVARVFHAAGHSKEFHLDLPLDDSGSKGTVDKTAVQATGSSSSYARRYLVCMIFNVTTEDDNDGNATRGLDPDERAKFEETIEIVEDSASAEKLWGQIAAACEKAGDVPAYAELKAKIAAKVKGFKRVPA